MSSVDRLRNVGALGVDFHTCPNSPHVQELVQHQCLLDLLRLAVFPHIVDDTWVTFFDGRAFVTVRGDETADRYLGIAMVYGLYAAHEQCHIVEEKRDDDWLDRYNPHELFHVDSSDERASDGESDEEKEEYPPVLSGLEEDVAPAMRKWRDRLRPASVLAGKVRAFAEGSLMAVERAAKGSLAAVERIGDDAIVSIERLPVALSSASQAVVASATTASVPDWMVRAGNLCEYVGETALAPTRGTDEVLTAFQLVGVVMLAVGVIFSSPIIFSTGVGFYLYLSLYDYFRILYATPWVFCATHTYAIMLSMCLGLHPLALMGVCVFAPLTEEYQKRRFYEFFGWAGVLTFSFAEMALYVNLAGVWVIPVRLICVYYHTYWTTLPYRYGVLGHAVWNGIAVTLNVLFGVSMWEAISLHMAESTRSMDTLAAILAVVLLTFLMTCFTCFSHFPREDPTPRLQGGELSAQGLVVRGDCLWFRAPGKVAVRVTKWPPLRYYREWDRLHEEGFRDVWSVPSARSSRWAQQFYLLAIDAMGGAPRSERFYDVLRAVVQGGLENARTAEEKAVWNRMMHSLNGNIDLDSISESLKGLSEDHKLIAKKLIPVILKLAYCVERSSSVLEIALIFSNELFEGADIAFDVLIELASKESPLDLGAIKAWFGVAESALTHQSFTSALDSEFVRVFCRLLASAIFLYVSGRKLPMETMLVSPVHWATFASFLRDLNGVVSMGLEAWECFEAGRSLPWVFGKNFIQLETAADELIQQPLPHFDEPDFIAKRDAKVAELVALKEALVRCSADRVELTTRVTLLSKKIATCVALMFANQLGIRPVVVNIYGKAGSGKSTFAKEIAVQWMTQFKHHTEKGVPEHEIYLHRANGNKHIDAMPNPTAVRTFIFDDFNQVAEDERQIAETGFLHAMASSEKTALPFASIEGKASATQLKPLLILMNSNKKGFAVADKFDRDSLARRVDLAIQCEADSVYGSESRPTNQSILFRFQTFSYEVGKPDMITSPKFCSLTRAADHPLDVWGSTGEGAFSESRDRVKVRAAVVRGIENCHLEYKTIYEETTKGERCRISGLTKGAHMGELCSEGCTFFPTPPPSHQSEVSWWSSPSWAPSHVFALLVFLFLAQLATLRAMANRVSKPAVYAYFVWTWVLPFVGEYAVLKSVDALSGSANLVTPAWEKTKAAWKAHGLVRAIGVYYAAKQGQVLRARLVGFTLLFGVIVAVYYAAKKTRGACSQAGVIPEEDNPHVKEQGDARRLVPRMVRQRSLGVTGTFADVKNVVAACTASVTRKGRLIGYALLSKQRAALCNHMVDELSVLTITPLVQTGDAQWSTTYDPRADSLWSPEGEDVAVLELSSNARRDISSHCETFENMRGFSGSACALVCGAWVDVKVQLSGPYRVDGVLYRCGFKILYDMETFPGMCGTPIVANVGQNLGVLLGIHHAGVGKLGYGQFLSKQHWEKATFDVAAAPATEPEGVHLQSLPEGLGDMPERKPSARLKIPAQGLGSDPSVHLYRQTNSLRPSILEPFFEEGGRVHFAPAQLYDKWDDERGVLTGPMSAFDCPQIAADYDVVAFEKAVACLYSDADALAPILRDVGAISASQALNGVPGSINPVDLQTSAGPGLPGLKSQHVEGPPGARKMSSELARQVDEMLAPCDDPYLLARAAAKKEVRPVNKAWNPRAFFVLAFAYLMGMRILLGAILMVCRAYSTITECSVGVNAASADWSTIGHALDAPGDYIFMCTDFKQYDKSVKAFMKRVSYGYYILLARVSALSPVQVGALERLFQRAACIMMLIRAEWFHFTDWQPSGDPITVEINSINQRLIYRYWFYKNMPSAAVGDFRHWVFLRTYGDDGLARVRRHPRLNQITFQEAALELGFIATAADKGVMREHATREELTFLKRGIIYDADFKGYRAPLERASIFKMLCWFDADCGLFEAEWAAMVLTNAACEWFLHGRAVFDHELPRLVACAAELRIAWEPPTFEELLERYHNATFTTWGMDVLRTVLLGDCQSQWCAPRWA